MKTDVGQLIASGNAMLAKNYTLCAFLGPLMSLLTSGSVTHTGTAEIISHCLISTRKNRGLYYKGSSTHSDLTQGYQGKPGLMNCQWS